MALLELQINRPEIVAFQFADGREYPSKIVGAPPQVMFTLVDGRKAFFPSPFAEQLRNAGIGAGQPFEVVKAEIAKGRTQLQFRPLGDAAPALPPANAAQVQHQTYPTPPPAHVPANEGTRLWTAPAAREVPRQAPPVHQEPIAPGAVAMCSALCAAVDSVVEAQAYAARRGLDVNFSEESVRAIGLTIFIQNSKGGVR